jgi:hypothetical protein
MDTHEGVLGGDRVDRAVARLHALLPLSTMLKGASKDGRALHARLLQHWLKSGKPLTKKAMQENELTAAARLELQKSGLVLFDEATGEITGAYPLTTEARKHRVVAGDHELRAMCALDALAVGAMLGRGTRATVHSLCEVTGEAVTVEMVGPALRSAALGTEGVHVGVRWDAAKDGASCASTLCMQMVFLRDAATAEQWQGEAGETAGAAALTANSEIFALADAVRFAAQFFSALGAVEDTKESEVGPTCRGSSTCSGCPPRARVATGSSAIQTQLSMFCMENH